MIKHIYLFLVFCFLFGNLFSQELIPFYDKEKQLWGFQNKETKQIIVQPQFEYASEWWNEYGIVMIDGKYGLIDRNGNKVSPFVLDYINGSECEDSPECDRLWSYYVYAEGYYLNRHFVINTNCDCTPEKYFPCPPMIKMDTSQTPLNLRILQQAEKYYHQGEITKAIQVADRAIEADTTDASTYFWKAIHLADMYELWIMEEPESKLINLDYEKMEWEKENEQIKKILDARLTSRQSDQITEDEYNIEMKRLDEEIKAYEKGYAGKLKSIDSLQLYYAKWLEESNGYFNVKYDTTFHLLSYYDQVLKKTKSTFVYNSTLAAKLEINYISKQEKKKIKKEIIKNVDRINRKSAIAISFNPGYTLLPFQKIEMNILFNHIDFVFKDAFPLGVGIGIGYERGIDLDFESYKAIAYVQPVGPLHFALNLMYARDADSYGIGFRPEFGFSFSAFTILYGFNFVSDTKFPDTRGNMVGIRLNLPVWRKNEFRKDLGNNLYRN